MTYLLLFTASLIAEIRYSRYADIGSGGDNDSCTACIVGTFADNGVCGCVCVCVCGWVGGCVSVKCVCVLNYSYNLE